MSPYHHAAGIPQHAHMRGMVPLLGDGSAPMSGIPPRITIGDWLQLFIAAYGEPIGSEPIAATTAELDGFWRHHHGIDRPHPTDTACMFNHPIVEIEAWPDWMED